MFSNIGVTGIILLIIIIGIPILSITFLLIYFKRKNKKLRSFQKELLEKIDFINHNKK